MLVVQFGKNFTYFLAPLAAEYLHETNISIGISHLLFFVLLDAVKKSFEEERNKNKDGHSRGVTTSSLP